MTDHPEQRPNTPSEGPGVGDGPAAGSPAGSLQTFLSYFWMDNTDEEARQQWRDYAHMAPAQAERFLEAVRAVLADPPEDLGDRIYQWAWRSRYDEAAGDWMPFSQPEALAWLGDVAGVFAAELRAQG